MFGRRLVFACLTAFVMLVPPVTCKSKKTPFCPPSSCGNIQIISYPFRLKGDPQYCGHHSYELSCENNRTILLLYSERYYVGEIHYNNFTMRVVDASIQRDSCSVLHLYSLTGQNFSYSDPYKFIGSYEWADYSNVTFLTFISCGTPVNSSLYLDTAVCNSKNSSLNSSSLSLQRHIYVVYGRMRPLDVEYFCSIEKVVLLPWASNTEQKNDNISIHSIQDKLVSGFYLWWYPSLKDHELVSNICHHYGGCPYYYYTYGKILLASFSQ